MPTTDISIQFSDKSSYSFTIDGDTAHREFDPYAQGHAAWVGQNAMNIIYGISFVRTMFASSLWHQNIVNLLAMEEIRKEEDRVSQNPDGEKHPDVHLVMTFHE